MLLQHARGTNNSVGRIEIRIIMNGRYYYKTVVVLIFRNEYTNNI